MKKLLLSCGCLVLSAHLSAQVNVTGNTAPLKLSDVVASYHAMHPDYGKKEQNILTGILPGLPKEENEANYQFDRWLWYWRQHVDVNGNLVSSTKTWQEWQKAKSEQKSMANARATSGSTAAWSFVGPDSSGANGHGVGRINVVAFHPTDANTFWIGAPGGGAWKTTDNGTSWVSMTDQLPLLSVSDIVFNPLNPNTVYLCTGDRDGDDYYGIGVLKSYDGGVTWNNTGMTWTPDEYNVANSMVINPQDTNTLVLATTAGMYTSHDGGVTFNSVHTGNYYQVLYCPSDTNILYTTTFNYFGPGNAQIWRSGNAGVTWTQQTSYTTTNRITLGVTPAAPNIVFGVGSAATGSNANGLDGIYKSSDTGKTYTTIYTGGCTGGNLLTWDGGGNGCGGQGWYTLPLAVSLTDSNTVFTGGVNTWSSSDGGLTWNIVNEWTYYGPGVKVIHADKHWMAFNPLTPATFFETNDGGIYSSSTPTATGAWNDLTNRMGIEEIYRTGVSNVASFAITGAQDDGTKIETIAGIYKEAVGGDGMACLLDFADSSVAYGSSEYGSIVSLNPTAGNPEFTDNDISANISYGTAEGTGNWVTPFVLEPSCHSCILAGYDTIYKSTDMGNTWAPISPFLPASDAYTLYRIATTTADPNTIYATDDNTTQSIYCTHDGGTTWTTITAPYTGSYLNISDIKVDPNDRNHFWITYSGYGTPQVAERDSAGIWTQMSTGLPDVPILCLAVDYLSGDLYVGTEIGVYYRDTTMSSWAPYTTGMPSDEVTDVEINYTTNELWASTYGRSLWKSPKNSTTILPTSVMNIAPFAADGITISPNPNHGNFNVTVKNIPDQRVKMHLTDASGKTVWQGSGMLSGGKMNVNIQGLITDTYIFEIDVDNVVKGRQKLVVY